MKGNTKNLMTTSIWHKNNKTIICYMMLHATQKTANSNVHNFNILRNTVINLKRSHGNYKSNK